MNLCQIILGYSVSTLIGTLIISIVNAILWRFMPEEFKKDLFFSISSALVGIIERFIYTSVLLLNVPQWIPIWLSVKTASQFKRWADENTRATFNIFLICSSLSILFGFLGAWIAIGKIPLTKEALSVISEPTIMITSTTNCWVIISALGSLILGISILITGTAWIWEHVGRNYFDRYMLDSSHNLDWVKQNITKIVDTFTDKTGFPYGSLYCFKIINKGTTQDYIYRAELDNGKGKKIDVSTNCILTGTNFNNENLPHGLDPLQGEVWFIAAKDADFINIRTPKLIIHTAAKTYILKMREETYIISKSDK